MDNEARVDLNSNKSASHISNECEIYGNQFITYKPRIGIFSKTNFLWEKRFNYSSLKINSREALSIICNLGTVAAQYFLREICIQANEIRGRILHLYLLRINIQSGLFVTFVENSLANFWWAVRMVYDRTRNASRLEQWWPS